MRTTTISEAIKLPPSIAIAPDVYGGFSLYVPARLMDGLRRPNSSIYELVQQAAEETGYWFRICCGEEIVSEVGSKPFMPEFSEPNFSEPNIYGQYTLSFSPTHQEVEQFIATMQASDRIVTLLDISLPSPRFIRATASQAWERNVGGGNWSLGDWFAADKFAYIWQESMRPTQQMRINPEHTLWAMQDRLNPETGDISLERYHYCCTAPNGDARLYESDVRIFELAVGPNPADKHLIRMMVSDRIENNPRAWEVLYSAKSDDD